MNGFNLLFCVQDDRSLINLHLMHTSYFLFVMVITMFCYAVIKGRPSKLRQSNTEFCSEKVSPNLDCDKETEKSSCWTGDRLVFLVSGDGDLIAFQREVGVYCGQVQVGVIKPTQVLWRSSRWDFCPPEMDSCSSGSAGLRLLCHNSGYGWTVELFCVKQWISGIKSLFIHYPLPQQTENCE